jgi:group I intron endonuclease
MGEEMSCGIYSFIHRDTLACYVGSAVDIESRRKAHVAAARRGAMQRLQVAIRALGVEAFDFEVLEECAPSELLQRERFYIVLLNAASLDGFNTNSTPVPNRYGAKYSEAHRARIGAGNIGKHSGPKHSAESRARMSLLRKGKPLPKWSAEQRAKIKGRKFSEETRRRMSEAAKARGYNAAALAKATEANRGKKQSAEVIEKRMILLRGQKRTEEQRQRMRKPHKKRVK